MIIPYDRPRGAIHDLAHLEELSDARCRILCVSDRTLYILHNLAALDVTFKSRFAVDLLTSGYIAVTDDDEQLTDLYRDAVTCFQLEVLDMTCDIQAGLSELAEAIRASGGGGCASYGNPTLNCIVSLDNDQMLGPGDSEHGTPGVGDPPEGFASWSEYLDYKCKAAHFVWDLERKHMVALRTFDLVTLTSAIVGPVIAGLAGVLPAAMTPAGFVVFVASVVAIGIVAGASWVYMDQMIDWWDDNQADIICSLYNSGTSAAAVSALSNAIEDAIQAIVAWGALEPVSGNIAELLGTAFGQLAGNGIVEPLFKSVVAATQYDADCSGCGTPAGLLETAHSSPYNVLLKGDSVQVGQAEDPTNGWQSDQDSFTRFYFTPTEAVSSLAWTLEVMSIRPVTWTVGTITLRRASDDQTIATIVNDVKGTESAWQQYSDPGQSMTLDAGIQYYLWCAGGGGNDFWIRDILFQSA